jgi:hypothetical protein
MPAVLCIDCKWHKFDKPFQHKACDATHLCTHPSTRSPVIGQPTMYPCDEARKDVQYCGPGGNLFEKNIDSLYKNVE